MSRIPTELSFSDLGKRRREEENVETVYQRLRAEGPLTVSGGLRSMIQQEEYNRELAQLTNVPAASNVAGRVRWEQRVRSLAKKRQTLKYESEVAEERKIKRPRGPPPPPPPPGAATVIPP